MTMMLSQNPPAEAEEVEEVEVEEVEEAEEVEIEEELEEELEKEAEDQMPNKLLRSLTRISQLCDSEDLFDLPQKCCLIR